MVKLIGFVRRKPTMSREAFLRYWKDVHYPLVSSQSDLTKYVRKYVQSHACEVQPSAPGADSPQPFDGVAELWFDNIEAITLAFNSPAYQNIVRPDELKFMDLPNCISLIVEEKVVANYD